MNIGPDAASIKILLVDDEENIRKSLSTFLELRGFTVETAPDGASALELLRTRHFGIILTDLKMPGVDGIELTQMAKKLRPESEIVLMTAYGTIRSAVSALKAGASNYLTKPLDHDELLLVIGSTVEKIRMRDEIDQLRRRLAASADAPRIIGESLPVREVLRQIKMAAGVDSTVLIAGETGVGKELVAQAIHRESPRAAEPLVEVNCASLPESLIESELFGHKKGSFTGAIADSPGKFVSSNKGTILLDEINSMSMSAQAKLLRVLENKRVTPIGGSETNALDVRVIAMSNTDLLGQVHEGAFREDLYYRLCVVNIVIAPLRDRMDDLPLLAASFLERLSARQGVSVLKLSPALLDVLMRHNWKGNIRELENLMESMAVLKGGGPLSNVLDITDLPEGFKKKIGLESELAEIEDAVDNFNAKMESYERFLISEKLRATRGNITMVSEEMQIPLRTLRRKLEKYGLNWRDYRPDRH